MSNLQLETILRILPSALENCDYKIIKKIQEELDKAKLRLFTPKYLEYFYEDLDYDKYLLGSYSEQHFKDLGLCEKRRIRNPREIKFGDEIYILRCANSWTLDNINKFTSSYYTRIFCVSNIRICENDNIFGISFSVDDEKSKIFPEDCLYPTEFTINSKCLDEFNFKNMNIRCHEKRGKLYIYK